jgi:integrase
MEKKLLTHSQEVDNIPFIPFYRRCGMKGGYFLPKGRSYYRCWLDWNKKKVFIQKSIHGERLYHEDQCKEVLNQVAKEIKEKTFNPEDWGKDRPLLFENAWETYQKRSPCGSAREDQREMIYRLYLLPCFERKSIRDIRTIEVQNWFIELTGHSLSPSYLRLIRATLRAFLSFHSDSLVKMPKFPRVSVPRKAVSWLSELEQEQVLEFVPTQHQSILRFIKMYGCRPSEACNLKKADIDWGKKIITLRDRKNDEDNTLPVMPEIEATLRLPRRVEHWIYVFSTVNGQRYSRQSLYHIWIQANRSANRKYGVRIVSLKNGTRHSKASQLLNQGIDIPLIARLLGNTPGVIERSYGRYKTDTVEQLLSTQTVHAMS